MKILSKEILQAALMGFLLPAILMAVVAGATDTPNPTQPGPTGTPVTFPAATTPQTEQILLPVLDNGNRIQMDLEAYVVGVLLAEVPTAFEPDALKAQAVAARTYALKCIEQGYKHDGAICTEYTCCQGYVSPEQYLQKGGDPEGVQIMESAVAATAGEVLVYDGALILATYFDCSGGSTEDAAAVWGQVYPYLQAVPSPGEESAIYYRDEKKFSSLELQAALGVRIDGEVRTWFGEVTETPGGGVDTMEIGGVSYQGTTLRKLLGLRSTVFTVSVDGDTILFQTKGYGHRVGMSQYGADAMALSGSDYRQILNHYYRGTEIVQFCRKSG